MEAIVYLIMFVLWLIWARYQASDEVFGKIEANKSKSIFGVEKHTLWTAQRINVGAMLIFTIISTCAALGLQFQFILARAFMFSVILILSFSYFHNGYFYVYSNKLNIINGKKISYPKGWKHDKGSRTEGFEIGYTFRTIMFYASVIILLVGMYYISIKKF